MHAAFADAWDALFGTALGNTADVPKESAIAMILTSDDGEDTKTERVKKYDVETAERYIAEVGADDKQTVTFCAQRACYLFAWQLQWIPTPAMLPARRRSGSHRTATPAAS